MALTKPEWTDAHFHLNALKALGLVKVQRKLEGLHEWDEFVIFMPKKWTTKKLPGQPQPWE